MSSVKRTALIVANLHKEKAQDLSREVKEFLEERGFDVDTLYTTSEYFKASRPKNLSLILSIGGDGTLLSVVHQFYSSKAPIFAINAGELGFITPFSIDDWREGLSDFVEGKAVMKKELLLRADLYDKDTLLASEVALNEVSVQKSETNHLLLINASMGDERFAHGLASDGVVVATPTGSTAYSMSVGGSVLSDGTDAFIFTPSAPFMAMDRGIVFPGSAKINIELSHHQKAEAASVDVDGRTCFKMTKHHTLVVQKAKESLTVVANMSFSDTERIGEKMMWKPRGD